MAFNSIETLAITSLLLLLGYRVRRHIRPLDRFNIPAPVIGGFLMAVLLLVAQLRGFPAVKFDLATENPLMISFFTSIGFGAGVSILRRGGPKLVLLLAISSVMAVLQGLIGAGIAVSFGLHPLYGVLTGTVTLSGGPATSMAFAPLFERAGVAHAATLAMATAMAGIVLAGLFGAPIATFLINRDHLRGHNAGSPPDNIEIAIAKPSPGAADWALTSFKAIAVTLFCMWIGSRLSVAIQAQGVTLPSYIGAMLVAGVMRNLDDATGWLNLPRAAIELIGTITLSLFLTMAMMTIDLQALSGLALPFLINLLAQLVAILLLVIWPVYALLGRNYEAAVTTGGFVGFMLGTTANAMAILRSLVEKYGPAPQAFLMVPMVGTFLLDFSNAIIITTFLNLFR